ncbi:hypothetical protein UlMin_001526 [Ulmus minor]
MLHLESRLTTLVNGGHSEERLGNLTMENGACPFLVSAAKCKKRKISAVRDFPPGCGRFAQRICLRPTKDAICADAVGNTICKDESSDRLKNETSDSSNHQGDIATQKEEMFPFLFLLNGSNSNGMDKSAAKKYLPSRNVSAVRQFPQFCGRNTHQLSTEMSQGVVASSKDNSLVPNKLGAEMDDKPSSQAAKTDVDKLVDDVQDGDSHKSKLEENDSEVAREEVQPRVLPEVLPSLQKTTIGQENSGSRMDGKQPTVEVITDLKQTVDGVQDVDFDKSEIEGNSSKVIWDEVQRKHEEYVGGEMNEEDDTVISSEVKMEHEEGESCIEPSFEDKLVWWDHEFETVVGEEDDDVGGLEENLGMEIVVYSKNKTNENLSDTSGCQIQLQAEKLQNLELSANRVVVQGLMAGSNCPWSQGKETSKSKPAACVSVYKGKKCDSMTQVERHRDAARRKVDGKDSKEKSLKKIPPYAANQGTDERVIWDKILDSSTQVERHSNAARTKVDGKVSKEKSLKKIPPGAAHQGTAELVILDKKKSLEHSGHKDPNLAPSSSDLGVFLPPFRLGTSSKKGHGNDATVNRNKVRETLRLFQAVCRKLLQEEEGKSKGGGKVNRRVDMAAAKILRDKDKYVNTGKQILGAVPGVEVGDEFQYRVELHMIGLHRQIQGGIDYVKQGQKILATSIVASGAYADDLDNSDVLIYTGQGGNVMYSEKAPEDQKLERGNLSLKNSLDEQTPVRVIRGCESSDGKSKTYVYDGFYLVKKFWQEPGPHGKLVFKFQLDRIPGQPELAWKQVKSKKFKVREGLCVADISQGKEPMPICAVNTIDDEKPPPFTYITSVIYPDWLCLSLPRGCDCIIGCSDSGKCACAVKNGGEIPFNHNGAIVEAKPLVYECGPSCRCPPTCHNRVSQKGTKFQLEIFKTKSRGWGVRSLNFIPSGSFVCEYIGELLKEKEAEERAGNDEYLFDIGNNYNDSSLWDGLSTLIPDTHLAPCEVVEDGGLTIDAAQCGNIGRFINHSCTPNLYAQNVLFDHDDRRIPHIMLFSAENIPPLQELTYHYNYTIDQVRDSNGNIRKKECFCGSHECSGRLY